MASPSKSFIESFNKIIVILAATMSILGLLMGLGNLIQPTVPEQYLEQNTRVCVGLIISGLVIMYAVFRPFSGGILICICAVIYFIIVNNSLVHPIILVGILSIIRGHLIKGKELEPSNDTQNKNK
jgi:phosphotransferase system  glucose/maltose/N-acetylglucosamine-specific IIC component